MEQAVERTVGRGPRSSGGTALNPTLRRRTMPSTPPPGPTSLAAHRSTGLALLGLAPTGAGKH